MMVDVDIDGWAQELAHEGLLEALDYDEIERLLRRALTSRAKLPGWMADELAGELAVAMVEDGQLFDLLVKPLAAFLAERLAEADEEED